MTKVIVIFNKPLFSNMNLTKENYNNVIHNKLIEYVKLRKVVNSNGEEEEDEDNKSQIKDVDSRIKTYGGEFPEIEVPKPEIPEPEVPKIEVPEPEVTKPEVHKIEVPKVTEPIINIPSIIEEPKPKKDYTLMCLVLTCLILLFVSIVVIIVVFISISKQNCPKQEFKNILPLDEKNTEYYILKCEFYKPRGIDIFGDINP